MTMPFSYLTLSQPGFVNPRVSSGLDDESIVELALHIGLHGLLNPPLVTEKGLVIAGQRRYRAIEWLIRWFDDNERAALHESRADLDRFTRLVGEMGADLDHEEVSKIERHAKEYKRACPVRVVGGSGLDGLALADNVQRAQLSGYEIARHLAHLHEQGATGANLARLIGKSPSYVSRKLTAWSKAGPELRTAWEQGLADDTVYDLAPLPREDQVKALAQPVPRGRRGPAHRPGIDTVKDALTDILKAWRDLPTQTPNVLVGDERYASGVVDALQWVIGEQTSRAFAKLLGGE